MELANGAQEEGDAPVRKDAVVLALRGHGAGDVVSQDTCHLHGVDKVLRGLQDGVVGHEVGRAHIGAVVRQVHCSAVGRVPSEGREAGDTLVRNSSKASKHSDKQAEAQLYCTHILASNIQTLQ